jgi:DNA-binding CsgD family transcriptional regulator
MADDATLRFVHALDHVRTAPTIAKIWMAVKEFAEECGYPHLACGDAARIAGGAVDAVIYTDAPQVSSEIDAAYAYATAPFVQRGLRSPELFLISELRNDPKVRGPWMNLMADTVQRGDALVVPVYDQNEPVAGFLFGGLTPDTSPGTRAMLQVLSYAAFARYRTLKSGRRPLTPHALTTREIQCLRAAAGGMSDAQIGSDLNISSRTVRFHMDGAKSKLKANTRVQAIAKALQEKIITI